MTDIPRKASACFDGNSYNADTGLQDPIDFPLVYVARPPFDRYRVDLVVNATSYPEETVATDFFVCTNVYTGVWRDTSAEEVLTYEVSPGGTDSWPLGNEALAGGPALTGARDLNYGTSYSMFSARNGLTSSSAPAVGGEYREEINLSQDARGEFVVRARLVIPNSVAIKVIYRLEIIMTELSYDYIPLEAHLMRVREIQPETSFMTRAASPLNVSVSTAATSIGPWYDIRVRAFGAVGLPPAFDPVKVQERSVSVSGSLHKGADLVEFPIVAMMAPRGQYPIERSYLRPLEYCAGRDISTPEVVRVSIYGSFVFAGEAEIRLTPAGQRNVLVRAPTEPRDPRTEVLDAYLYGYITSSFYTTTLYRAVESTWKSPYPEGSYDVVLELIATAAPTPLGHGLFNGKESCVVTVTVGGDVSGDLVNENYPDTTYKYPPIRTDWGVKKVFRFFMTKYPNVSTISATQMYFLGPRYQTERVVLARRFRGVFPIKMYTEVDMVHWASQVRIFSLFTFIPRP